MELQQQYGLQNMAVGNQYDVQKMGMQFSQQLAMNDRNFQQDIQKMTMQYDMNSESGRTDFKRDLISK
jgi:hypothetical protein